jgi:hypothetical protein
VLEIQQDMLSQQFYKLDGIMQHYCFDILKELMYSSKGKSVQQLHLIFNNSKRHKINEAIKYMYSFNLIQVNKSQCIGNEKVFTITKSGLNIIKEHFNYLT